jgi:hypothetical protein
LVEAERHLNRRVRQIEQVREFGSIGVAASHDLCCGRRSLMTSSAALELADRAADRARRSR